MDLINSKVTVKVLGISQAVAVPAGSLIDVFLSSSTTVNVNGQNVSIFSLSAGQRVNIKALWENNKLTASSITVEGNTNTQSNQGQTSPQNSNSNSTNSPGNAPQNILQNLPVNQSQGHQGKPF